jgi:hypothetical protein
MLKCDHVALRYLVENSMDRKFFFVQKGDCADASGFISMFMAKLRVLISNTIQFLSDVYSKLRERVWSVPGGRRRPMTAELARPTQLDAAAKYAWPVEEGVEAAETKKNKRPRELSLFNLFVKQ